MLAVPLLVLLLPLGGRGTQGELVHHERAERGLTDMFAMMMGMRSDTPTLLRLVDCILRAMTPTPQSI